MTFLNPFVLFGLAAASIPVLLHLLNLRKLRTVEFSSVRFLKELQKTSMRRLRIRQILLLVLRTLLIAALVLAFARPTLNFRFGGFASPGASSTMVIVVDDSPSMNVHDERGTAFARALGAASGLIDIASDGDRLYLVGLSGLRPGSPLPSPRTPRSAREALGRLSTSPVSVPLAAALRSVRPLIAASPDANREVIFVSDGQATQLRHGTPGADSGSVLDPHAGLFLCFSPPLARENTGITGGEVLTRIVAQGRPAQFRAHIRNEGNEPVRESVVSLYAAGTRVAQQSVSIPPRGEVRPVFSFAVKRKGILACAVKTEDDALDDDNTYAFVLDVPEHITVLLTGPDPPSTRLAALALTLGGDSLVAGGMSAAQTTNTELVSADIAHVDVIVMCGFEDLTSSAARKVAQFVRDGGGLILFPHDAAGPRDAAIFRELALPVPPGPAVTAPAGSFISFSSVDDAHPLFEGLFESGKGPRRGGSGIESPRIQTALPLAAGEKGARVIGMTNGFPFLVDYAAGSGRVLAFAVEAGTAWSDFPLKGLFAPILHRGIAYTGSPGAGHGSLEPGDPLSFSARLRTFTDRDTYTITSPDGRTTKVVPAFRPGEGTARFSGGAAGEPGVYMLARDARGGADRTRDIAGAAVNISPEESDLRTATDADVAAFGAAAGIEPARVHATGPDRAAQAVRESRYGVEVWRDFVLLALVLAIAEMAVGRAAGTAEGGAGA